MNSNHKVTILALSLSVLTLATISTVLSLSKSGVLGVSIAVPTSQPLRPTITPPSPRIEGGVPCEALKTVVGMTLTTNPVYTQLNYLLKNFCPTTTPRTSPAPSPVTCKTGVSSFTLGRTCMIKYQIAESSPSYYNAKVTCYDGSTQTVGDSAGKICYQSSTLEALAKKFCDGKTTCPKTTNRPSPVISPKITVEPTKPTTGITGVEMRCGWCGTTCTTVKSGMVCPMVAAESGKYCINRGGICTIVSATTTNTAR